MIIYVTVFLIALLSVIIGYVGESKAIGLASFILGIIVFTVMILVLGVKI